MQAPKRTSQIIFQDTSYSQSHPQYEKINKSLLKGSTEFHGILEKRKAIRKPIDTQ